MDPQGSIKFITHVTHYEKGGKSPDNFFGYLIISVNLNLIDFLTFVTIFHSNNLVSLHTVQTITIKK